MKPRDPSAGSGSRKRIDEITPDQATDQATDQVRVKNTSGVQCENRPAVSPFLCEDLCDGASARSYFERQLHKRLELA